MWHFYSPTHQVHSKSLRLEFYIDLEFLTWDISLYYLTIMNVFTMLDIWRGIFFHLQFDTYSFTNIYCACLLQSHTPCLLVLWAWLARLVSTHFLSSPFSIAAPLLFPPCLTFSTAHPNPVGYFPPPLTGHHHHHHQQLRSTRKPSAASHPKTTTSP